MNWSYVAFRNKSSNVSTPTARVTVRSSLLRLTCCAGMLAAMLFNPAWSQGAGPQIDVWYGPTQSFGALGNPQIFVNVVGRVTDSNGVKSLSYTLNGGPSQDLSIGPDGFRLHARGDFNADIPVDQLNVMPQTNEVIITATDTLENQSQTTVTVEFDNRNRWPLPYSVDWSNVSDISDVAQIVDGLWELDGIGARTARPGWDRSLMIGDLEWQNYEVTVPITIHQWISGGTPFVNLGGYWRGNSDSPHSGYQPKAGWNPSGTFSWYVHGSQRLEMYNSENKVVASKPFVMEEGKTYMFRKRVQTHPQYRSVYSFKVWESTEDEPFEWDLISPGGASDPQQGSLAIFAARVDQTVGDIDIVPVGAETNNSTGLQSDDFTSGVLNPDIWTYYDPQGDGTLSFSGAGTNDSRLELGVPAGSVHDNFTNGLQAPHVMQTVQDGDFEIEVKFDSAVSQSVQLEGVLIKQDDANFLRFDFYHDGANTRIFATTLSDLVENRRVDNVISASSATYMRIRRDGDIWNLSYSSDGQSWTSTDAFVHQVKVTQVGLHVVNARFNPAHTAMVDYFSNTFTPAVMTDEIAVRILSLRRSCITTRQARREVGDDRNYSRSCLKRAADITGIDFDTALKFLKDGRDNDQFSLAQIYTDAELAVMDERLACRGRRSERRRNGVQRTYARTCTEWAADTIDGIGRADALRFIKKMIQ